MIERVKKTAQSAAALVLAVEVIGVGLVRQTHAGHAQPGPGHEHTPGTHYGTIVSTSASALNISSGSATFDRGAFRVYYAQPLETLTDPVSKNVTRSPVTFLLA